MVPSAHPAYLWCPGKTAQHFVPPSQGHQLQVSRKKGFQKTLPFHSAHGGQDRSNSCPRPNSGGHVGQASPITQNGFLANLSLPLQPRYRQQQPAAQILTKYSTPNTTMVTISWEVGGAQMILSGLRKAGCRLHGQSQDRDRQSPMAQELEVRAAGLSPSSRQPGLNPF